jgi:hypothetical protein
VGRDHYGDVAGVLIFGNPRAVESDVNVHSAPAVCLALRLSVFWRTLHRGPVWPAACVRARAPVTRLVYPDSFNAGARSGCKYAKPFRRRRIDADALMGRQLAPSERRLMFFSPFRPSFLELAAVAGMLFHGEIVSMMILSPARALSTSRCTRSVSDFRNS